MLHKRVALPMIGLALALLWPGPAVQAQTAQNCQLRQYASLDMWTEGDGRVDVPVMLEGQQYRFLVDTGGFVSTISPFYALYRMKLPVLLSQGGQVGVGGIRMTRYVVPHSVSIGGVSGGNIGFFLNPPLPGPGTIAPNLLRNFDLDFDFAQGKLNLFSPDHCDGKVVYWTHDAVAVVPMKRFDASNHIVVDAQVDGKEVEAVVDSGARDTFISARGAREYLGIFENDPRLKPVSPGSKFMIFPFRTISFAGVSIANPRILIFPDTELKGMGDGLTLGISSLRRMHMYVAYKEHKLYLSSALAH